VTDESGRVRGKLRVSEVYVSVQGEGPRTGMGTLFLRFGGCNLRCPGWPCDTLYAVEPRYRADWERRSARDVALEVVQRCQDTGIANVCLTGGEPFLQPGDELERIVDTLLDADISVEAFTNGQVEYPEWAFQKVQLVMDWKLPGSGNPATYLTEQNIKRLKPTDAIKFVIRDDYDFNTAFTVWSSFESSTPAQWWAGIVWNAMPESTLVDWIQREALPWHLNVQLHKYLWSAEKRGV
jgi:7-carboxy-7-deazaguanine synthase